LKRVAQAQTVPHDQQFLEQFHHKLSTVIWNGIYSSSISRTVLIPGSPSIIPAFPAKAAQGAKAASKQAIPVAAVPGSFQ